MTKINALVDSEFYYRGECFFLFCFVFLFLFITRFHGKWIRSVYNRNCSFLRGIVNGCFAEFTRAVNQGMDVFK